MSSPEACLNARATLQEIQTLKGRFDIAFDQAATSAHEKDILEAQKVKRELEDKMKRFRELVDKLKLERLVKDAAKLYEDGLKLRLRESGSTETISINPDHVRLPENLTPEHLEAVKEALGGRGLEERILPTLQDLNHLNDAYINAMYPATQSEADTKRGLKAYRPSPWAWDQTVSVEGTFKTNDTWGKVYVGSMREELKNLGGSLVLLDTATKPNYTDGSQNYGSVEGKDPKADPLLPLFQEAFGKDASRFYRTWREIEAKLLPLAKKKIQESFASRGLEETDFEVMLVPAVLDNQEMTLKNPESSSTNTWDWTSTPLLDDKGTDTGRRLSVGSSEDGGAGGVIDAGRGLRDDNLGARLAVIFKKHD